MEDKILISYLGAWNWQILSLLFLVGSFIMFALPRTLITGAFYIGLFLIFIGCEFMSLKRKREIVL